ncbi:MAG TPA: hypothetical protein DCQ06_01850, partial [Myxococcales bacterium]|nr:hypothetical protein [Myxococcales bacterium]
MQDVRAVQAFVAMLLCVLALSGCGDGPPGGQFQEQDSVPFILPGDTVDAPDPADTTQVDSSTQEVTEDAEADIAPDTAPDTAAPCPGGVGCPCQEAADCDNGICIQTDAGKRCAQPCVDNCPKGFDCETISVSGSDTVQICIPKWGFLCAPCSTDAACKEALGDHNSSCVEYPDGAGQFCGSSCLADDDCPDAYSCKELVAGDGQKRKVCAKNDGICPCSPRSVQLQLSTSCLASSELGTCPGSRQCKETGPIGPCSAPEATAEVCDGLDNDCNGQTDDGLCDDNNPCTQDGCGATGGCVNLPTKASCDDDNACTTADACDDIGNCGGAALQCDDTNPCTADSCAPDKGCVFTPHNKPCNDGNACTTNDLCDGKGGCTGSAIDVAVTCDDSEPCTKEICDPKAAGKGPTAGCQNLPQAGSCDDGNPCTNGDACSAGTCKAGANICACTANSDCKSKDDGNLCNGSLYCDKAKAPYFCKIDPKTVVSCDTSKDSTCASTICNSKLGACENKQATLGKACDADGSVCTAGDACKKGTCVAGPAVSCDDKNPCTTDSCDPNSGCKSVNNVAPCDADDSKCTVGDQCANGGCLKGKLTQCDDNNPCTSDSCDPKTGKCVFETTKFTGQACDADGSKCTVNDACQAGTCVAGKALKCDDNNPCTTDSCEAKSGCKSVNNIKLCDADGDLCTSGDKCANGNCVKGKLIVCDDTNPCTADSCDPKTGKCVYDDAKLTGQSCDADGSKCTVSDACQAGTCVAGKALKCDDNNPCTGDTCDPKTGCKVANQNGPCDADGNLCTAGDKCANGTCIKGKLVECDDNNPCTVDSCTPNTGKCAYNPTKLEGQSCDADGSKCTVKDLCKSGACVAGAALKCDDNNLCTTDSCDPASGCKSINNIKPCDADGDLCTAVDQCANGVCVKDKLIQCDDKNPCTADSCNPKTGKCVYDKTKFKGQACDADGSKCTVKDACDAGVCVPGSALNCDDKNPCTADTCDAKSGCKVTNKPGPCDADGDPCTLNDSCNNGGCVKGAAKDCDDKNKCTIDACDSKSGKCVYDTAKLDGSSCDADGSKCTVADACKKGVCAAGATLQCDDKNPCTI